MSFWQWCHLHPYLFATIVILTVLMVLTAAFIRGILELKQDNRCRTCKWWKVAKAEKSRLRLVQ